MRVLVGMSGGVDSTVAAALLKKKGHRVIGVTMVIYSGTDLAPDSKKSGCYGKSSDSEVLAAGAMAELLGIEHHVIHLEPEFLKSVVDPYLREYMAGLTPAPCVLCNRDIKFGALLEKAKELSIQFDAIATGHYARILPVSGPEKMGLFIASDTNKDQTFFLHRISPDLLPQIRFPLGEMTKETVRQTAKELGLSVHDKDESKGFFAGDYRILLPAQNSRGKIVHAITGKILGEHEGYWNFTIGQRKGLGIDTSRLNGGLFVTSTDPASNTVFVGGKDEIRSTFFSVTNLHWLLPIPKFPLQVQVKVGNTHPFADATLSPGEDRILEVHCTEPIIAVAPGQPAVFYRENRVLGGGIIQKA